MLATDIDNGRVQLVLSGLNRTLEKNSMLINARYARFLPVPTGAKVWADYAFVFLLSLSAAQKKTFLFTSVVYLSSHFLVF
jgi:hypothetical protein